MSTPTAALNNENYLTTYCSKSENKGSNQCTCWEANKNWELQNSSFQKWMTAFIF